MDRDPRENNGRVFLYWGKGGESKGQTNCEKSADKREDRGGRRCGGDKKDTAKAAPAEEKVLTVYTARSESLNNLVIPAFEKETGIKVNVIVAGTIPRAIFSGRLTRRCWIPRKNFLRNMYLRKMRI